jgi:TRAP-type transport system periplasmic protein
MKTNAQFSSTRKGALAMTLYPLAYAGGELPETNIALMPALTTSYKQGLAWKAAPVGRELAGFLADKGIIIVSWIWQAGGAASRERQLIVPEDVKGMKVRGGSREMDLMLQAAGAAVLSLPSNELYAAMQTGACDAGITSSTSLISFRLEELSKHLTSGRNKSYWYMLEPLMMSRIVFEKLSKDEQSAIMAVGEEMETFGLEAAMADDVAVGKVFEKAGARVSEMDDAVVAKWRDIARATAWKDYAGKTALSARLMALAEQVGA